MEAGIPHRKMRKALGAPDPGRRPRPAPQGDAALREFTSEAEVRDLSIELLGRARREMSDPGPNQVVPTRPLPGFHR
jgi:hypothetical protein